ncbi:hypothetical protein [Haladaptatus sp. CMAA 1911]|uniref:hypothetical protein n=1 Tax=unclassified Haladaptatus TaxID=2622732 RepID=UPI003755104B
MPVLLTRREPDDVARANLLDRTVFTLDESAPARDNESLPQRVDPVPERLRPGALDG